MSARPSRRKTFARVIWGAATLTILARWWPSDRFDYLAAPAYAPVLIVAPFAILASIFVAQERRRIAAIAVTLLVCVAAFFREQPAMLSTHRADPPSTGKPLRILLYNVQSFSRGAPKIADVIDQYDPDVVGLLEATSWGKVLPGFRETMGDRYVWTSSRNLALGSRIPLLETFRVTVPGRGKAFRTTFEWEGEKMSLWLIDMPTPPFRRVQDIYKSLEGHMAAEALPTIVIGDFNTPRQSALLSQTFADFEPASSAPGSPRYLATWPSIAPIWQIDHCFVRGVRPVSMKFVGGDASDHLAVLVEIAREP